MLGGLVQKTGLKTALLALTLMAMSWTAPAAAQQQPIPPEHYTLDARGVDLVSGAFNYQSTEVVIGDPTAGGIAYGRSHFTTVYWRDGLLGTINASGSRYVVSLGSRSAVFTKSGSTYTPQTANGASLTQSGTTYTYTASDGAVGVFTGTYAAATTPYVANIALLQTMTEPNGASLTWTYEVTEYCPSPDPEGTCWVPIKNILRILNVTSNRGYRLLYEYVDADPWYDPTAWMKVVKVTGVNMTVDACHTYDCLPASQTWPSVTYSVAGATASVQDQMGRTTTFASNVGGITSVTLPGDTTPIKTITYYTATTPYKVSSVTDATGTWNYAYTDVGTTRTTLVTGPLGQSTTVVSDMTIGRATAVSERLSTSPLVNLTTAYQYDAQRRMTRVTRPEGDYTQLIYDSRGNVIVTTHVPKTGSGPGNISTSAEYSAACLNRKICNQPLWTTDERGFVTNYTYDAGHGGVLTVAPPAPATGVDRPQTRITYAAQTAWYKNSAGVQTASATSVILPTVVSACATGVAPACVGTGAETRTTIAYGTAGVGNNLLPTSTSSGNGTGTLTATTAMTYTTVGDVASVDGPLPGTGDTTRFRYDLGRQRIGVVGPDPDGAGTLLNRARRFTYSPRGQVTLVEAGTVAGITDPDWAAFATLQRQQMTYDEYARPVVSRQQGADATTHTLQQVSYDAAGRPDCSTTRMNPATFASLPAACTLGPNSDFGPDRISKTGYDAVGRPVSLISGFGSGAAITETVTYTPNSRPQNLTDGSGNTSIMVYDGFDRLNRLRYPNAGGGGTSTTDYDEYTYDAASNVTLYRDRSPVTSTITAAYDALGRRVSLGGAAVADRTFAFDNLNRLTGTSFVSGGPSSTRTYDALGRVLTETQSPLGAVNYSYDLAGRRSRITWPDAVYATYDYNVGNDLTAVRDSGDPASALAVYAYDNLGRQITATRSNGAITNYGYDAISRLYSLTQNPTGTAQDVTFVYGYSAANQIIYRSVSNAAYAYGLAASTTAYDNDGLNRVTLAGGTAVTYDARQNITSALGGAYTFNAEGQLQTTNVGGGAIGYSYDPSGRLYEYTGGAARRFLYDGAQAIAEYDGSGAMVARYVPGMYLDDVVTSYAGSGMGNRSWLLADERGSVIGITNGSGGVSALNTYDEYGVPAAGNVGRFQYTGQAWLSDAQLYYYRARTYDPRLGRFLQPDPIGYAAGTNLYGYVDADPINYSDPSGTCPLCIPFVIGFGVSATVEAISQIREDGKITWGGLGKIAIQGGIGGSAAIFGGGVALSAGRLFAPILAETLGGVAGGALGGSVGNGLSASWKGENIAESALRGGLWGGALGGVASYNLKLLRPSEFSRAETGFSPLVRWQARTSESATAGTIAGDFASTIFGSGYDIHNAFGGGASRILGCGTLVSEGRTFHYCMTQIF